MSTTLRLPRRTFCVEGVGVPYDRCWSLLRSILAAAVRDAPQRNRTMMVANELLEGVDDPWNNMEVRVNQRQAGGGAAGMQLQREWTKAEDRYLLCLINL